MSDLMPCLLMVVLLAVGVASAAPRTLDLGFGGGQAWQVTADAPWWALVDLRHMLNCFHPYSISETGRAAGATTMVTIPADWRPPFALRFFCADDYFADAEKHKPGMVGVESFFGHRYKQVLVDDTVVWEADFADENTHGSPTTFTVDLTPHVQPGVPFRLTLRVWDKVTTAERNERDVWFIGGTWYAPGDGKTEQPPRFHTAVWFVDPVVGESAAVRAAPAGRRPHEAVVAARHAERWPLRPLSDDLSLPVKLRLIAPADIPATGFPLTCGLPFPPGLLRDAGKLGLRGPGGQELPVQTEPTAWWPDRSLRWVTVHTLLPPGTMRAGEVTVHADGRGHGASPLRVTETSGSVQVDTGALQLDLGGSERVLVDRVRRPDGTTCLEGLRPRMTVALERRRVPVEARWQRVQVLERGPVRARVELHGTLRAGNEVLGRFTCRLLAYAGLPTVQVQFRTYNDLKPVPYEGTLNDAPLDVADLRLVAEAPGVSGKHTVSADATTVAPGRRPPNWVTNGGVHVAVWRFWQQYPKRLALGQGRLEVGLFAAAGDDRFYRPRFGEAKRHDIWLTFARDPFPEPEAATLGRLADEPPRLFDGPWFCGSAAISLMDPQWPESHPQLWAQIERQYGDFPSDKFPGHYGLRNFGDAPYKADPPQWLNGYWAMVQGTLNWGLASGRQAWVERSFEIARHIADVDTVHLPRDHPDWEQWDGMTCALGTDHSVHDGLSRWAAFQIGESLMLHHWVTGDPDSRAAALANAEWIIRNTAGLGSSEARSQARPMLTLLRAWEATGDTRYRDAARRYLDLRYQIEKVIDWRRGAYIQPTYENWRCVSAGLDSMYAMNIYEYYRLTGDVDAAQLVVAVADSVYAESMLPQEEGLGSFLFYVRYSRGSWYYTQMAILFHMAYDLTGDLRFLRAGRAAFARYLLSQNPDGSPLYQPVHNFGWLDPEYAGWARHFRDVKTEPFDITSQTPVPDPANY